MRRLFSEYGEVTFAEVVCTPDGKSQGRGTVRFASADAAQRCAPGCWVSTVGCGVLGLPRLGLGLGAPPHISVRFLCRAQNAVDGLVHMGRPLAVREDKFAGN